jgi:hypothetical protein
MRRILVAGLVAGIVLLPSAAFASVSMTVSPTPSVSWSLASTGSNTTSGGTLRVAATESYLVTVSADRTKLTEYITGTGYASSPKALAASLSVLTTLQSGLGVPISPVSAGTSAATIATGTGTVLTPATDTYGITLSQATAITDPALPSGRTYHLVLTYTASAAL